MKRDLRFEFVYPHPPELVWKALTERAAIQEWLMQNDFEPKVGHEFQFRAPPQPGWNGIVDCRVLECAAPRRLVYTWNSNALETVVSYTLSKHDAGTRLVLEHTGFSGLKAVMISYMMGRGWKGHIRRKLQDVVERCAQATGTRR